MSEKQAEKGQTDYNRRDFIKGATSFSSMMLLMGGIPLEAKAEDKAPDAQPKETGFSTDDRPVTSAVIGCGARGKEILQTLAVYTHSKTKQPLAPVAAICDIYKPYMNKVKDLAPQAEAVEDYRKVLEMKNVETVIVATPTHMHREIVVAALQAGKHVYCEAPIATTIEDAKAIAQAAKAAQKVNFQSGLQMRADPGKKFVLDFVHSRAVGTPVMGRSQWHKRTSWRKAGSTPERDKALNWRLDSSTSIGLAGEIGIHQLDLMSWMLGAKPQAITGFGSILDPNLAQDGRDVADTIQCVLHFPGKVNSFFDCTLANSFDSEYDMLYGNGAAILFRPEAFGEPYTPAKAWLFEEVDSQTFRLGSLCVEGTILQGNGHHAFRGRVALDQIEGRDGAGIAIPAIHAALRVAGVSAQFHCDRRRGQQFRLELRRGRGRTGRVSGHLVEGAAPCSGL